MLAILCIGYPCAVLRSSSIARKVIKVSQAFAVSFRKSVCLVNDCLRLPVCISDLLLMTLSTGSYGVAWRSPSVEPGTHERALHLQLAALSLQFGACAFHSRPNYA